MSNAALVTWAPGGNLPPLLAAGSLLAERGYRVHALASGATTSDVERGGFEVHRYRRAPDPDMSIPFERQAGAMMGTAARVDVARDVCDLLVDTRAEIAIVDCMLPAGLAAGRATGTPTVSLVHFPYGLARRQLVRGDAWTTDLHRLNITHRSLGLPPVADALTAWEAVDLVLVAAPRWFDVELDYPRHVVHAGPLGIRTQAPLPSSEKSRVLASFSTTAMDGQLSLIQRVCDAVAEVRARVTLTLGPAVDAAALRLPANVDLVPWGDHDGLLRGCAAVVTHAGAGTTLRALAHGVPLIMLPLGRDQGFNASRVSKLGAGLTLPCEADPALIRSALERLLNDRSFSATAARVAAHIAADDADRRAADALERCAGRRVIDAHR